MEWIGRLGLTCINCYAWNRSLVRAHCTSQGSLLIGLWWPKPEGDPKRMWTDSRFIPTDSRDQHIVKQACAVLCLAAQSCLTLATPWTVACQAPLSMGILQAGLLEWVACFPPRGLPNPVSNPALLHCRRILYHLSLQGSPWSNYTSIQNNNDNKKLFLFKQKKKKGNISP